MTFIRASLRRYLRQRLVFRWLVVLEVIATATTLVVFYLVSRFQKLEHLAAFNTSYFGYVTVGLAVAELCNSTIGGIFGQLHDDRNARTLEQIFASPVSIERWALAAGLCNLFRSALKFLTIALIAVVALGLVIPSFSAIAALTTLCVAIVPMWCIGVLSLSSTLMFRKGDLFGWFFNLGFEVLGGIYVPLGVLPRPLQSFSEWLPITPVIRAMESVFYNGATLSQISGELARVALLTAIYLPASLVLLRAADRRCRRNGYYSASFE